MPPPQLYELVSQPGIRRDGTSLDSPFYNDGVWVRFQRGKPRKMGGYRAMSTLVNGPVRSILVDSRNAQNSAHMFSPWGVQRLQFSAGGSGGNIDDRTPLASFVPDPRYTWTHGIMASSTGGSYSALLAAATPDINQLDSDEVGYAYSGDMSGTEPLQVITDAGGPIGISGGLTVLQPFLFLYGSNGLIKNSKENDFGPGGWTGGNANEANVAGTKIVYGAPVRGGGQSPAGLFWALDALIRVSYNGDANTLWSYDTLSSPTSLLGKKAIIEHDGKFFWPGTDRFLFYNGVVQELPNQMNSNWFFENLNMSQRNKVWAAKIPRYGEIWWFYPRGASDECDHAVIFNYLENTWYDAKKERTAGGSVGIFPSPIWAGSEDTTDTQVLTIGDVYTVIESPGLTSKQIAVSSTAGVANGYLVVGPNISANSVVMSFTGTVITMNEDKLGPVPPGTTITVSSMLMPFTKGDRVTGETTGATGIVARATRTALNVKEVTGEFNDFERLDGILGKSAVSRATPYIQRLDTVYQHEFGVDKTIGEEITALPASVTSRDFGFAVGQPNVAGGPSMSVTTRLVRLEPDYSQKGDLQFTVEGRSFPKQESTDLVALTIDSDSNFEDIRGAQARILRIKIESNTRGGDFDQGRVMSLLQPGDERSGEIT